jgi:hypothetical protein
MAGWFDGLFQGAAEVENRFSREDGPTPRPSKRTRDPGYLAGFRQGVLDARAVAVLRRAEAGREAPGSSSGSGKSHFEPRT